MKKIFAVLLLASVWCAFGGEFDFGFQKGLPGWKPNNGKSSFDAANKVSGSGSLKLVGDSAIFKRITLEPDTDYEVTVYIKADNVTGGKYKGVLLRLTDNKSFFAVTGASDNLPRQGTFDWTKCTRTFSSSRFKDPEIRIMPALTCEGTAWFADLSIVKKGKTAKTPAASAPAAASAEEGDFAFAPGFPGWEKNCRNFSFDTKEKITGAGSLKLASSGYLARKFQLEPDTEYEVSVYIKADNVTGGQYKGVLLRLTDGNKYFAVTGDPKNLPRQGTFDRTKCTRTLKSSFFKNSEIKVMAALTGEGTVWFDDIRIEKKKIVPKGENSFRKQYGDAVKQIGLIPEGVFGFFDPGEEVSFRVLVDSKAKELEYAFTVKDEAGREVYRSPRKKLEDSFRLPGQEAGYYVVDAEIFADGKKAWFIQSAFAVGNPARPDPFFQFGYGAIPEMIPAMKRLGVGSVVLKNGELSKPEMLDRTPEQFTERYWRSYRAFLEDPDLVLCIHIGAGLPVDFRSPEEFKAGWPLQSDRVLKHLLDCVAALHRSTRGRVREWSVGCEIPSQATGGSQKNLCNTWTEAMFNVMIRARTISRQLKSADPTIRIIVGGNNMQECTETVERIVMSDLVRDFDEYAIDAYTGNWNMVLGQHSIPELRLLDFYTRASNLSYSLGKGKVIRNDETGYSINYGARFDRGLAIEQAELTARTIIITRYAPVSRFELHKPSDKFWFSQPDDDTRCMTTCWKPFRFGSTGRNFHHIPLPGGAMYATAAGQLSHAKALAEVKNGDLYSYLFQKPDGSVLITLWNIARDQQFRCTFPAGATAVNMYGRTIPANDPAIGKGPVYITVKMPPEEAVALMKKAVFDNTLEFQCAASGNKVYIRSFAAETRVCRLRLPGQPEQTVKLLPGRINTVEAVVTGAGELLAPDGRSYPVTPEKVSRQTLAKLKSRPVFDGSGSWLEGLKAGALNYPGDIRPPEALQQERRYFRSDFNPEGHNISAQYWTAYDDDNFYLAVKVDDPVHQQRQKPAEFWRDDSLQFVLSHEAGAGLLAEPGRKARSQFNFGLALTAQGPQLVKYLGSDKGLKDFPAKVTRNGNTTFYEVAVPWQAIGGKAKRFGFVVFDNNWPTAASAPYYLAFSDGIAGGADDTRLKVLDYAE